MAIGLDKRFYTLVKALDGVKRSSPSLWEGLSRGLEEALRPETRHIIRAPLPVLAVAQGRAQVSDEILSLRDNCSEIAKQLEIVEAQAKNGGVAPGAPPKFN